MLLTAILFGLVIFGLITAFLSGLQPKRHFAMILKAISWFDVIMFGWIMFEYYFGPYYVGQIALLIFARSILVCWGSYIMIDKHWKKIDYDPDTEQFISFLMAVISGAVAFWGTIVGLIIDRLVPYIASLLN